MARPGDDSSPVPFLHFNDLSLLLGHRGGIMGKADVSSAADRSTAVYDAVFRTAARENRYDGRRGRSMHSRVFDLGCTRRVINTTDEVCDTVTTARGQLGLGMCFRVS